MRRLLRRLAHLATRARRDADLREEIETHRSLRQAALEREGMTAAEAERASRVALGNVTLAREDARAVWRSVWLESVLQDVRLALRSFAHRPLVWGVAVLSLAFGIGVNTAIFSLFEQLTLRRLPVSAYREIVNITSPGPRTGSRSTGRAGGVDEIFSYPLFRDLEGLEKTGLAAVAAHREFRASLSHRGDTAIGDGLLVSGHYFDALGVVPALGRLIAPGDDRTRRGRPVVVLSHEFWTRRFDADPRVLADTLHVNGQALTIVGVAPAGFTGTARERPDLFVPLAMAEPMRPGWSGIDDRADHWLYAFGRLEPGATRQAAEAALNVPFAAIIRDTEYPAVVGGMRPDLRDAFRARRIHLDDGSHVRGVARAEGATILLLLLSITGCVLLIACANVANLLLARSADRSTEIAVRLSIGASPARVFRWLLTETFVLGALAGLAALVVARLTLELVLASVPAETRPPFDVELSAVVWLFTLTVGLGTGLVVGLFPALQSVRAAVAGALHGQSGRSSDGRSATRLRTVLAATQIALATALLTQAMLLIVSLDNMTRAELGIRREGLLMFGVSPDLDGYGPETAQVLIERVSESLSGLPGVTAVSTSSMELLGGSYWNQNLTVEGFTPAPGESTAARRAAVGEGYFRTIGVPILAGREFSRADSGPQPTVAIVNEAFAARFNLGPQAIGKRIALGAGPNQPLGIEIVGLARDAASSSIREAPPPQFFLPLQQANAGAATVYFYVRSASDASALLGVVRDAVRQIDPDVPIVDLQTMDDQIWSRTAEDRVLVTLSASFAGLATLLAGIGLYAVVTYIVARRWREFGIRLALGATAGTLRWSLFAHVGRLTAAGTAVGIIAAVLIGRLSESFLYGVDGGHLPAFACAVAVVIVVASGATILPARRAASISPIDALRTE